MDSDELLDRLEKLGRPALRLIKSERPGARSKLGGSPSLPNGMEWPSWKGTPLAFLAQVDLSELPRPVPLEDWPPDGTLYFFYESEQQTWGFDPEDRGSWRVLYSPGQAVPRASAGAGADPAFPEKALRFEQIHSLPEIERTGVPAKEVSDETFERFEDLKNLPFDGEPKHQLGGYPDPVQNDDMELECQLASNGVYCGGDRGADPRAADLEGGAGDWQLLLQIDSDEDMDMMWGDMGMLYFWIRTEDLKKRDFSNVWMVLQCG